MDVPPGPLGDLDEEVPECAYFLFGGPRHYIDIRFAMAELKLALMTLIDRPAFDSVNGELPELSIAITLQPTESIEMRVTEQ